MTSKNLFFKLMKEDLKRRLWAVALITLAFFFSLPVIAAFMTGDFREIMDLAETEKYLSQLTRDMQTLLSVQNGFINFLMVVTAIICGCSSFSYLNSKKKVDFYHSIPVRRETLFFANFLNGILIVAIPYLVNILVSVIIASINGVSFQELIGLALLVFLFQMVHYLVIYATVVVAVMMTGKLLVGLLGTGVFFFYVPCIIFVIMGCFSTWFRSYYFEEIGWFSQTSPLSFYLQNVGDWTNPETNFSMVKFLLVPVIIGLILSGIALFLYRIRPSEAAGKAMAFEKSKSVIRILIVFASAIAGCVIFWQFRDTMGWGLFGLACGCMISHCVIEIIYNSDFKKLFSHKWQLLGTGLFSLAFFLSFRYDWFSYDSFLPKANEVETASINFGYVDNWVTYGGPKQQKTGAYRWEYESTDDYIFSHMRLTDVEPVLDIAKAGILRNEELKSKNQVIDNTPEANTYYASVTVEYQMKNGRKKKRTYYLPLSRVMESTSKVYNSREYKEGKYPLLQMKADELSYTEIKDYGALSKIRENQEALLEAYQEDFKALTLETRQKEAPIAEIRFVSKGLEQAILASKESYGRDFSYYGYYPVYPSFKKTIALLKEQGIDVEQKAWMDSIDQMIISDDRRYSREEDYEGVTAKITDMTEQKEILESSVFIEYLEYNDFWLKTDSNIGIKILVDNGNETFHLYFINEKIPTWVKERIKYDVNMESSMETD